MHIRQLQKMDLNLLVSLQILLEEGSVSRAAERLHITQPAMSKTLSRLRELFDDPLFTRHQRGIQPTPRALEIKTDLSGVLSDMASLIHGPAFDPSTYTGEIVLALSEYVGVALLPPLIQHLHQQAPGLSVHTITRVERQLEQLAAGNLDFAIHISQPHYSHEFITHSLGTSPPAIMVRQGHPLTRKNPSWEYLSAYPMIRLYISDIDQSELARSSDIIQQIYNRQPVSFETSHLMTALEVLRKTDYFLPGPAYMMENKSASRGIVMLPPSKNTVTSMQYMLVMHRRCAKSQLHQWLWQQIQAMAPELN
ncbi:MAG: LysR family transcriptional regulator [Parahaliea sp.]